MTDKEKLIKAKQLIDIEIYEESKQILESINLESKSSKFIEMRNLFLSCCYQELGNYHDAIELSLKVSEINNSNELASQIRYLSYANLKEFDKAINEVIYFLKNHQAELYKVTLKELMIDIMKGNIELESQIEELKRLAIENKIYVK